MCRRPTLTLTLTACLALWACGKSTTQPAPPVATPLAEALSTPACTWESPLTPGVPGSPGHLIPSDVNPNGMSELAQLMRTMLADLQAVREQVKRGAHAAIGDHHARVRCSWPTTLSDRNAAFDTMAVNYLASVDAFNAKSPASAADFDAVVSSCLACHAQTCAGPMAAIKPLAIDPLPGGGPTGMFE